MRPMLTFNTKAYSCNKQPAPYVTFKRSLKVHGVSVKRPTSITISLKSKRCLSQLVTLHLTLSSPLSTGHDREGSSSEN